MELIRSGISLVPTHQAFVGAFLQDRSLSKGAVEAKEGNREADIGLAVQLDEALDVRAIGEAFFHIRLVCV